MIEADLEDGAERRFFIKEGSVPSVRTTTALGDIVDRSVHIIAAPRVADLWRNLSMLPEFLPLFKVLVWRSVSLRHTQSFLGILWLTIQPIASTLMVFFMFNIIKVNT